MGGTCVCSWFFCLNAACQLLPRWSYFSSCFQLPVVGRGSVLLVVLKSKAHTSMWTNWSDIWGYVYRLVNELKLISSANLQKSSSLVSTAEPLTLALWSVHQLSRTVRTTSVPSTSARLTRSASFLAERSSRDLASVPRSFSSALFSYLHSVFWCHPLSQLWQQQSAVPWPLKVLYP